MNRNKYASVVNTIGLISLLLGVFIAFTSVKTNVDSFNTNKAYADEQFNLSKESIQKTIDYKNGIGIEELSPEDLVYLQTINDSIITAYSDGIEEEYQLGLTALKGQMWDDVVNSSANQASLILLGIALIFVAKGLNNVSALPKEDEIV